MESCPVQDLLIRKVKSKKLKILVCAKVVERDLSLPVRDHHVLSHVRILLCLNCILEKIVIYGYNGNCGVKERLTMRKL